VSRTGTPMYRVSKMCCLAALVSVCVLPVSAASRFSISHMEERGVVMVQTSKSGKHRIEIDDAPGFRTPILIRVFRGTHLELRANDFGLVPGLEYYAKFDGDSQIQRFRLMSSSMFTDPVANCVILRRTWEKTGRKVGEAFSGLKWESKSNRWVVVPHTYLLGASLYNAELLLRPALNASRSCGDLQTLDDLAQYYLAMLQQTETVGTLLSRPNALPWIKSRMASTDQSARTFPATFGDGVAEGELYNAQWLHPAAQLVRLISLLPLERRSAAMKSFSTQYTPFIVREQLDRYLVQQKLPRPDGGTPVSRVEQWKLALDHKGSWPWNRVMSDVDLWLLACAAQILGANANDPALAPIDNQELETLRSAVQLGVRFFRSQRTDYPDTKNFRREQVGSASYFNGEYIADEEYAYSAVTSEGFPMPWQRRAFSNASWDISHAYRLPIFLRALYENRKATGLDFPQYKDLEMVVNQYLYRVFNGDYSHPLFHNFLDGSDGWYRIGYNGAGFGHPPSEYCDQHDVHRPCLTPGNVIAWGQLAFVNPDLARLEQALVKLALDKTADARKFKDRYYFYADAPYEVLGAEDRQIYATELYFIIADSSEMIANQRPGSTNLAVNSFRQPERTHPNACEN